MGIDRCHLMDLMKAGVPHVRELRCRDGGGISARGGPEPGGCERARASIRRLACDHRAVTSPTSGQEVPATAASWRQASSGAEARAAPIDEREAEIRLRPARPADVRRVYEIVSPYATRRILVEKSLIAYFESVQEFLVAEALHGSRAEVIGCGALHVMWEDLAEIRTLAVTPEYRNRGIGHLVLGALVERARDLDLRRLFCLTFEVDFFAAHGFEVIDGTPVAAEVYEEMLRSPDDGVAEFLDLAHVKPNTLGNSRMLLHL